MRTLLFLLPVLLASCGTTVTQNQIFAQARAEIARREPWADNATILIQHRPDEWHLTWRAVAGSFDFSESPGSQGLRVTPGTERELRFTRHGCLMTYSSPTNRCLSTGVSGEAPSAGWTSPGK